MKSLLWSVVGGVFAIAAGCSSAFTTGSGGAGTTTPGTSSSSGNSSSSGSGTGGTGTGGATTTTTKTTTTSTTVTTTTTTLLPPCPPEEGVYTMMASGQGCGDLDVTAKECIKPTGTKCDYEIATEPGSSDAGSGKGVAASMLTVDMAGGFLNGTILEGTGNPPGTARSGCIGVWKPGSNGNPATLTIDCGGVGTSQSCRVVLTRAGDVCPF